MRKNIKGMGTAVGVPVGLSIGVLTSIVITILGAAAIAGLAATERIGEGSIGHAAKIIPALAAALGAWSSVALVKRLRLQMCMMTGGSYYLILLAMTALFFGGQYQGMGMTALIVLAMCTFVAFIPGKNRQGRKRKNGVYR